MRQDGPVKRPSRVRRRFEAGFAAAVSPAASLAERIYDIRVVARPDFPPPIFIIGAPRTGSTILYQALTNYFDVLYIDNLVCRWRRNLLFGFLLSRARFGDTPHDNFESEFGDTSAFSDHAPSECGGFWYRWLPRDRHFIDDHECDERVVRAIRMEVVRVSRRFARPLMFKNLNAGQRLRLIHRCFPDARLIHIQRDLDATVGSIVSARSRVGVNVSEWWSIRPKNYEAFLGLGERDMVSAQVRSINNAIEGDMARFPEAQRRTVRYDELSAPLIEQLGAWLGLSRRQGGSLPAFGKGA
jgi:hypothetical protein